MRRSSILQLKSPGDRAPVRTNRSSSVAIIVVVTSSVWCAVHDRSRDHWRIFVDHPSGPTIDHPRRNFVVTGGWSNGTVDEAIHRTGDYRACYPLATVPVVAATPSVAIAMPFITIAMPVAAITMLPTMLIPIAVIPVIMGRCAQRHGAHGGNCQSDQHFLRSQVLDHDEPPSALSRCPAFVRHASRGSSRSIHHAERMIDITIRLISHGS